jgi:hypothetical protein
VSYGDQDPVLSEHLERLRRDEAPTPVGSETRVIKSHRSLTGLDNRRDLPQRLIEVGVGVGVGLIAIGIIGGWLGGFLYLLHLMFGG